MTDARVVCGRWRGQGPECSVTVGTQIVDAIGIRCEVLAILAHHVIVSCSGGSVEFSHGMFFGAYRPAPPESRWLDPASVSVGAWSGRPTCLMHGCLYPPHPRSPTGSCAWHAWLGRGGSAVLPPSVLTPVPRWRSLVGTKWAGGRPERTASVSLIPWLRRHGAPPPAWVGRLLRASRVRKVIHAGPATYAVLGQRGLMRWVLA